MRAQLKATPQERRRVIARSGEVGEGDEAISVSFKCDKGSLSQGRKERRGNIKLGIVIPGEDPESILNNSSVSSGQFSRDEGDKGDKQQLM